jgi:hypothetical protein
VNGRRGCVDSDLPSAIAGQIALARIVTENRPLVIAIAPHAATDQLEVSICERPRRSGTGEIGTEQQALRIGSMHRGKHRSGIEVLSPKDSDPGSQPPMGYGLGTWLIPVMKPTKSALCFATMSAGP